MRILLFLFALLCISRTASAQQCFSVGASDSPSLTAIGLTCLSTGVTCEIISGECRVTILPNLIRNNDPTLTSISFTELIKINGALQFGGDSALQSILLPKLTTILSSFDLNTDPVLTTIDVSSLSALPSVLNIFQIGATELKFDSVQTAERIYIQFCPDNTIISFAQLKNTSLYLRLLDNPKATTVSFPSLTSVGGVLDVVRVGATSLVFDNLQSVDGHILAQFLPSVTTISFPVLTNVTDYLKIADHPKVTSISIPLLTTVPSFVDMNNCPLLVTLNVPLLESVGALFNMYNLGVSTLSFASLTRTGVGGADTRFFVQACSNLVSVSFPALTTIGAVGSPTPILTISFNPVLTSVSLPQFVGQANFTLILAISGLQNLNLAALASARVLNLQVSTGPLHASFPALVSVATLAFAGNGLKSLDFPELVFLLGDLFPLSSLQGLVSASFAKLTSISGKIQVQDVPKLTTFRLPAYAGKAALSFSITAPLLTVLDVSSLAQAGVITLNVATGPLAASFPALVSVNTLSWAGDGLQSLDFPELPSLTGDLSVSSLAGLVSASFGKLSSIGGNIQVQNVPKLTTFRLPMYAGKAALSFSVTAPLLTVLDISALAQAGDITFNIATGPLAASFPSLLTATNFKMQGDGLQSITAPNLVSLGLDFRLESLGSLVTASFAKLASVGGFVKITDNAVLVSASIPSLKTVGASFDSHNCPLLTSLDVSGLESVARQINIVSIAGSTLTFDKLKSVGTNIFVLTCSSLSAVSFPSLTTIGSPGASQTIRIDTNALLRTVEFPVLNGGFNVTIEIASSNLIDLKSVRIAKLLDLSSALIQLDSLCAVQSASDLGPAGAQAVLCSADVVWMGGVTAPGVTFVAPTICDCKIQAE